MGTKSQLKVWLAEPWKVLALVNGFLIAVVLIIGCVVGGLMGLCFGALGIICGVLLIQKVTTWTIS